jgi:molybdate transport system regulatory protein
MGTLELRSRHWIVDEDENIIMGEGRMEILENIEKTGSINKTAKNMKMSYKGVWSRIRVTEEYMRAKIVVADKRRGSRLTREGKALMEKYRILKAQCLEADDRIFEKIFKVR